MMKKTTNIGMIGTLLCLAGLCLMLGAGAGKLDAASMRLVGVDARLVSEAKTIVAGQTFTIALSLKHKDEYHTYWKNPGTVGVATMLDWVLPKGFKAGEIQWQVPERVTMVIYNTHGYAGDTWLLVDITAPEELAEGDYSLKARAAWMTCAEKNCCNVAFQDLQVSVKAGAQKQWNEPVRKKIKAARSKLPKPLDGWTYSASREGEWVSLKVKSDKGLAVEVKDKLYFYSALSYVDTTAAQQMSVKGDELTVKFKINSVALDKKLEAVEGLFYHPDGWPGSGGQKYMPLATLLK